MYNQRRKSCGDVPNFAAGGIYSSCSKSLAHSPEAGGAVAAGRSGTMGTNDAQLNGDGGLGGTLGPSGAIPSYGGRRRGVWIFSGFAGKLFFLIGLRTRVAPDGPSADATPHGPGQRMAGAGGLRTWSGAAVL